MLRKILIHGLLAAALIGSAAAVDAQTKDNGFPKADAAPARVEGADTSSHADQRAAASKISTDGEVRHAMSEIRELVAAAIPAVRDGKFGTADFHRLADGITDRLQQVSAHNRLPEDAQAKLNAILAPLAKAARDLKVEGERSLSAILTGLEEYGRAVDHAGWQDVKPKNP